MSLLGIDAKSETENGTRQAVAGLPFPVSKQNRIIERKNKMLDIKLLKNSVLFKLRIKCAWGNSGKGTLSDEAVLKIIGPGPLGESPSDRAARIDKARSNFRLGKKLILCEEYDSVREFQCGFKSDLLKNFCNPSFIDEGLYFVKTEALGSVIKEIKAATKVLRGRVDKFLEVYPSKVKAARAILGEQFNAANYPDINTLLNAFSIDYRVVKLDVPEGLPPEIRQEEEKKLRDTFKAAEQELTLALREGFSKILEHVTDRLQPGEDGKRKKFTDTLFVDFVGFIESFSNKNILGDAELNKLVEQAKGVWQSVANGTGQDLSKAAKRVREIEPVREKALAALSAVKSELDKTIAEMPSRAFDFEA